MRKRKSLTALAAAVIMLIVSSGCHGSRDREVFEIPQSFDETARYEITFWSKNDNNRTQTAIYEKTVERFQEIYPNITVVLRPYSDYGKIYNDVITNIPTNTTPNVCITYPDHIATYLTGENTVVPLDELMNDSRYGLGGSEVRFDSPSVSEIIPQYLGECRIGGVQYAMPFMRSSEACYINKSIVEKLGYTIPEKLTWDFIWEVSDAAAKKDADGVYYSNGQKVMLPFIYKSTDNMMIQLLKQSGGAYSDSGGNILIFNDTTKSFLYEIAEHVKQGSFSTFKISSYPGNFLNAGQCVFAIDSTAGSTWMGPEAPLSDIHESKKTDFEIEVKPVPQLDPDEPYMISQGPSVCIFNKADPGEVLASWLFVQYLLTNEVQTAYSETEGYIPVTSKAQSSAEYADYLSKSGIDGTEHYSVKIDTVKMLLDNIDHTFVTPVFSGSASLRDAAGQLIENVTKSVRRKETVDEAYMEKLFDDTRSLYRLDQISASSGGKAELGELPDTAVILLSSLAAAWVLIIAYAVIKKIKAHKRGEN